MLMYRNLHDHINVLEERTTDYGAEMLAAVLKWRQSVTSATREQIARC